MIDLANKYNEVVGPLIDPFILPQNEDNPERATLLHQIGLIQFVITFQQIIQGTMSRGLPIPVGVMGNLIANPLHWMADRITVLPDVDESVLQAIIDAMAPDVVPTLDNIGIDFYATPERSKDKRSTSDDDRPPASGV